MLKLIKYAKPYRWMFLLAIALLFAQAMADLTVPDMLAKIVNVGIQQGGMESAVPEAIRQSTLQKAFVFMKEADQQSVLSDYNLVDSSSPDYQTYLAKYPVLANEPVYVLKNISQAEIDKLNPVMAKSLLAVTGIEQVMKDPSKATQMGAAFGNFDLSKLPPGTDVFAILAKLPADQRAKINATMEQRFSGMGDAMIVKAGASAVQDEYKALGMAANKLQTKYIMKIGSWMLLLTLASGICTVIVGYLAAKSAAGMARDMRRDVFKTVEGFSSTEFDKFSTASLITRTTNDVTQIQMLVLMMVRMMFYAPIIGIGGIIKVLAMDSPLAWLIGVAVLALVSMVIVVFSITVPKFRIIQKLIDRINLVMRENLSGMMVVRAFNMQEFEEQRFDKANLDATSVSLFVNRVMVIMFPLMMLIMNVLMLAIVWFGAKQVAAANMEVGDMLAFMQYAMQIVMAFLMFSFMFIMVPRASVSGDRIYEVISTEPHINDPQKARKFPAPFKGSVEFRNVSFRYPGADTNALENINFTARPGQTTALIGSTGSGKSTVVNLIPRFYEVTDGSILVDGVDIRDVTQHDLRDNIGYVPQKSALFSGTIESNLKYADEKASPEKLESAIEIAQAKEFIETMPEGIETEISQGGTNVSGGQKQRLSIARAIVKKPPIYILDDSFSALDFRTDAALRQAFKQKTTDSTLLIVSQRVSTIKNAEQIIVLDDGRIVGKGTHKELMENCDTYKEIALSQLSREELA
jgi:ATP-binding cassette, subfamily B, multidrug efflux pump